MANRIMRGNRLLELWQNCFDRCAAMTHEILLLIEKLGNCASVSEQEKGVVTEPARSALVVKDSTLKGSFAYPDVSCWRCNSDSTDEAGRTPGRWNMS